MCQISCWLPLVVVAPSHVIFYKPEEAHKAAQVATFRFMANMQEQSLTTGVLQMCRMVAAMHLCKWRCCRKMDTSAQ